MNKVNPARIEGLYNTYYNRMIGMIVKMLKDPHIAQDIYNQAFEDLIKYLDTLDYEPNEQHLEALIVKHTKWRAIDEARRRTRRQESPLIEEKDGTDEDLMEDLIVDATNAKAAYERLKEELDEHHLNIMALKYGHEYSSKEIGEKYNIKENYVNQILLRSRKKAQKILRSFHE